MFFRIEGWIQTPLGAAVAGANVAVLDQPASFETQPGSPLADIYSADASNSASISAASWAAQQIEFTFSATPPVDVVPNSFIAVSGASPAGYNSTLEAPWLVLSVVGDVVTVAALTNPGAYVSGGTVATSVLPNPLTTDGNGYYFGYTAAGLVSLQIYYSSVELDYPDQPVGTVAGGSVTSVALTMPAEFVVAGSPISSTGTFVVTKATQNANLVYAGPAMGTAAVPGFRALVASDLPGGFGTVSSVGLSVTLPAIFTVSISGSPVTGSGTLGATIGLATESANTVWAGPTSGSAAQPTFRALVFGDILVVVPVVAAAGATDTLTYPSSTFFTGAGIDNATLATPTAGTDDGKPLCITDTVGFAHTVTTASNKIVPSHHLLTFNGTKGSFVELEAYQGLWYVGASSGVVAS